MNTKKRTHKGSAEKTVRNIRRATRRPYSAEEKIRIVLKGLRGEGSIAELCRKEGINQNLYYRWSKEFLEAEKKRLAGDTVRGVTSDEVKDLRQEALGLKELKAPPKRGPVTGLGLINWPFGTRPKRRPSGWLGYRTGRGRRSCNPELGVTLGAGHFSIFRYLGRISEQHHLPARKPLSVDPSPTAHLTVFHLLFFAE